MEHTFKHARVGRQNGSASENGTVAAASATAGGGGGGGGGSHTASRGINAGDGSAGCETGCIVGIVLGVCIPVIGCLMCIAWCFLSPNGMCGKRHLPVCVPTTK